jgi:hypothetical protein
MAGGRTNMPTMAQFCQGRSAALMPWARETEKKVYKRVRVPGISMRNQPIFPGMLKGEEIEVLPIGYHVVRNCTIEIYLVRRELGESTERWELTIETAGKA